MLLLWEWLNGSLICYILLTLTGAALSHVVISFRPWGQLVVPMRIKLRIYQRAFLFTAHVVKLKGKGIFIVNIFAFVSLLKARFLRQFLQKTQNVSVFTSVFVHQAVPGVRMIKPVTRSTDFVTWRKYVLSSSVLRMVWTYILSCQPKIVIDKFVFKNNLW